MITQFHCKTVILKEEPGEYTCDKWEIARDFWNDIVRKQDWFDKEKENLVVIALDTKLKIKGFNLVSMGTLNESLAHPREIFRPLISISAYGFILMHNHPSGDSTPSMADGKMTSLIREAAEIIGINFYDHVIVGDYLNNSYSFRESGRL